MAQEQNNSKTFIGIGIALVAVFGIVLVLFAGMAVLLYSSNSKPESSITVDGTASEKVKPDTAIASFVYSEKGDDAQKLNEKVDEVVKKVTSYLKDKGVEDKNIVSNKTTYPDYRYSPDGQFSDNGLVSEVSFEVTFSDINSDASKPNTVLKGLVDLGINRFYGFRYTIENTEEICDKLENEAIEKAYNTAQNRVNALGGGKIISREVVPVGGSCGQGYAYPMYATGDVKSSQGSDGATETAPELLPGEQELTVNATVKVVYK